MCTDTNYVNKMSEKLNRYLKNKQKNKNKMKTKGLKSNQIANLKSRLWVVHLLRRGNEDDDNYEDDDYDSDNDNVNVNDNDNDNNNIDDNSLTLCWR